MDYAEKFSEILNQDETVIKVYKPNKVKYLVTKALSLIGLMLFFALFAVAISFAGEAESTTETFNVTVFVSALSTFCLIEIALIIYLVFFYKNLYYCVTSERLLIRRGVFGTDFKTLDMRSVGAINVHVSLIDKIVRKNTGSMVFGSNSAPIFSQSSTFIFRDIVDPYGESKSIKTTIDSCKQKTQESN